LLPEREAVSSRRVVIFVVFVLKGGRGCWRETGWGGSVWWAWRRKRMGSGQGEDEGGKQTILGFRRRRTGFSQCLQGMGVVFE